MPAKIKNAATSGFGEFRAYLYFLISTLRLQSYASWRRAGQPNPFLKVEFEPRSTTRSEITNLFFRVFSRC